MRKYTPVEPTVVVHTTGGNTISFEVTTTETTIRFNGAEIAHVHNIDLALAMTHIVEQIKRIAKGHDDVLQLDKLFSQGDDHETEKTD